MCEPRVLRRKPYDHPLQLCHPVLAHTYNGPKIITALDLLRQDLCGWTTVETWSRRGVALVYWMLLVVRLVGLRQNRVEWRESLRRGRWRVMARRSHQEETCKDRN
jgi:hypothetical protein